MLLTIDIATFCLQISKTQNAACNQKAGRSTTKSLAELQQRKQEVISQLEKVVGKNTATEISNTASNLARQESRNDLDSPKSPYTFWTDAITSGPTFVRSDSILAADDDYVPYDPPAIGKYGPISRMHKDNVISRSVPTSYIESPSMVRSLFVFIF